MRLLVFGAFLIYLKAQVLAEEENYCFAKIWDDDYRKTFGSKTTYKLIKGSYNFNKQDCEPQKIWIFQRHGTRQPDGEYIQEMPRLLKLHKDINENVNINGSLCPQDVIMLKVWQSRKIDPEQQLYLTNQGQLDMEEIAKFYSNSFKSLFSAKYNSSYYRFRHTKTQRTTKSFEAFARALFGDQTTVESEDLPARDLLLRPYDYCAAYEQNNYEEDGSESAKFKSKELWTNMTNTIAKRLGLENRLTEGDIALMYETCRYEAAWKPDQKSPWCVFATKEHFPILEYDEDLRYFYKSGYGNELNERINCRAVKDMLQHLASDDLPAVVVNFGHSSGLQTLITALGLRKDSAPLTATATADNEAEEDSIHERIWHTSKIDPFAANFAAVKYRCTNDASDKERVSFVLNQEDVTLDVCEGVCDLSLVLERYKHFLLANCDEYYCPSASAASRNLSLLAVFIAALMYTFY